VSSSDPISSKPANQAESHTEDVPSTDGASALKSPAKDPSPPPNLGETTRAAIMAGWIVSQLHGPILDRPTAKGDELPSVSDFDRGSAVELALQRLQALMSGPLAKALTPQHDQAELDLTAVRQAWNSQTPDECTGFKSAIETFHLALLTRLTVSAQIYGSAYSVGRTLSDICWQPTDLDSLRQQFAKAQLSNLHAWLTDIDAYVPTCAKAVATSLDHWGTWLEVSEIDWNADQNTILDALHSQGGHWRSILIDDQNPTFLLTPEAFVEAGEAALRRAGHISIRVIVQFWWLFLILVLATAAVIVVAFENTNGAARVWTTAVSLLASIGVTGTTIRTTARNLATEAGHTLFNLEEVDAVSWAVTWLPPIPASAGTRRQLRRRGVASPQVGVLPAAKPASA
jgi:hypothetical protein